MGDFENMLNSILSNPKDMERIMGLARELTGDKPPEPEPEKPKREEAHASPPPDLNGLTPGMLSAIGKILGELNKKDDGKAALIASMKPYVRPERRETLDRALKIARIARIARTAINELGGDLDLGL